MMVGRRPTTSR